MNERNEIMGDLMDEVADEPTDEEIEAHYRGRFIG